MRFSQFAQAIKELATHGRLSEESQDFLDSVPNDRLDRLKTEIQEIRQVLDDMDGRLTSLESSSSKPATVAKKR